MVKLINIMTLVLSSLHFSNAIARDVHVFVSTLQSPSKLKESMKGIKEPGLNVKVYSKYRDFKKTLKEGGANASFLALAEGLEKVCASKQKLIYNNKSTFKLVAISIDEANKAKWDAGDKGIKVAFQNILGRKGSKKYMKDAFGKDFKKTKLTARAADLFPLLALGNADVAVLPEYQIPSVKKEYNTKFSVLQKSKDLDLPVLCGDKGIKVGGKVDLFENVMLNK